MQYIINKTAKRDYVILDTFEAGIVLTGSEVKSIKNQRLQLEGSYVKYIKDSFWLVNANIPLYQYANDKSYDSKRMRRLLLQKKEIERILSKLSSSPHLTVIPLKCYISNNRIKIKIALAKGKKLWEKKRIEKELSEARRQEKEIKDTIKQSCF